jgi:hypothetical protein
MRTLCTLFVLSCVAPLLSQVPAKIPPSLDSFRYLLRMQRVRRRDNVCLLLQKDGQYHFEHDHADKILIFEGTLSTQDFERIRNIIDADVLRSLSDSAIQRPLILTEDDIVQISIFRKNHWQTLYFPDKASRKPFKSSLDPLLASLDKVPKLDHQELSEDSGKNNCLTPQDPFLKKRQPNSTGQGKSQTTEASGTSTISTPQVRTGRESSYVLRILETQMSSGGAKNSCVIVYPNGLYHREEKSQTFGGTVNIKIYEKKGTQAEVSELSRLLDVPALRSSYHYKLPVEVPFLQAEIATLSIPRDTGIQELSLTKYETFRRFSDTRTAQPQATTQEFNLLKPLRDWINLYISPRKELLVKDAKSDNCKPSR